jgi:hypothetical protein
MPSVKNRNWKIKNPIVKSIELDLRLQKLVGKIKQPHKPPYGRFEKPNFLKPFSTCTNLSAHDATHFGRIFCPPWCRPSIHRF